MIYDLVSKRNTRIEICCKLVGLVDDEEDTVKVCLKRFCVYSCILN